MTISLITVLAMLSLYRTLMSVTLESAELATSEGQKASGLSTAQIALQQAGFGLPLTGATKSQVGKDLMVISGAVLSEPSTSDGETRRLTAGTPVDMATADPIQGALVNAIVWGYNPSAATTEPLTDDYRCGGLVFTGTALVLLRPMKCTRAEQWKSLNWTSIDLINPVDATEQGAFIQVRPATCWPFSTNEGVSAWQVLFPVKADATGEPKPSTISFTTCLANFTP